MKGSLFENINSATYFLWEYTKSENALRLWQCAEEIAHYFQKNGILSRDALDEIFMLGKEDSRYIDFIRNVSYRIYDYTASSNTYRNWFMAENLVKNNEWCNSIINSACIFDNIHGDMNVIESIKNEKVRNYYIDRVQGGL